MTQQLGLSAGSQNQVNPTQSAIEFLQVKVRHQTLVDEISKLIEFKDYLVQDIQGLMKLQEQHKQQISAQKSQNIESANQIKEQIDQLLQVEYEGTTVGAFQ